MAKADPGLPQREPWPVSGYWDRRAPRSCAQREAAFQRYLELSAPYVAAIEAAGGEPWFADQQKLAALERSGLAGIANRGDIEARRNLFYRRYTRPQPPAGIPIKTLAEIRGDTSEASTDARNDPEARRRGSAPAPAALARSA